MGTVLVRRRFGQHFLADEAVVERIFATLRPDAADHVLEIGPGTGVLTARLAREAGSVAAVEVDRDLVAALRARDFGRHGAAVDIVSGDALKVDLASLLARGGDRRRRVVGNLPYNIATPLLERLFRVDAGIADMHFMLQAEVAHRLTASPGSKAYGRLSVAAQWWCRIDILFEVEAESFTPPPKVDSAFVRLVPRAEGDRPACDPDDLGRVLRTAFSGRRKTLANALESLAVDWRALEIDPGDRAENLTVEDFVAIAGRHRSDDPVAPERAHGRRRRQSRRKAQRRKGGQ